MPLRVLTVAVFLAATACAGSASDPPTPLDPVAEANLMGWVALCNDGNYSTNTDFRATCSGGDGIDRWLAPFGECADGQLVVMGPDASCPRNARFKGLLPLDFTPTAADGDVALCLNGTFSDNTDFRATCSANGGVDQWLTAYGECVDGTIIEISASASCRRHAGFAALLPADFVPPTTPDTTSTTTSTSTTSTTTTSSTSTTVASTTTTPLPLDVQLPDAVTTTALLAALDMLTVVPEASLRQGYSRDLFPHWQDVNGSGCTTRQDMLLAQVIGLPQRDLFDPCVIVEGDWYSLFDGVTYSGAPGEIDIDHVVALSEAWDSGAAEWPTELRRRFANDPLNLLVVTRVSNQSKADKDAGEWKPARRDAWCVTATMMIFTKARYSLTIDARERTGLAEMAETCGEPDQRAVPGLPLPGTADFDSVEPVVIPPPTTAPPPPASTDCTEDQVDINRAGETELQRIIHIGAERAPVLISLRPYTSVRQLTRINGIGDGRLRDIVDQGLACV